jgi:hypothetical protein
LARRRHQERQEAQGLCHCPREVRRESSQGQEPGEEIEVGPRLALVATSSSPRVSLNHTYPLLCSIPAWALPAITAIIFYEAALHFGNDTALPATRRKSNAWRPPPSIDDPVETIAQWIFNNPYRPLARPQGWPDGISEPLTFPNGERVQLLRLKKGDHIQTAAVRLEHPDQQQRHWRTDCILTTVIESQPTVRFAVTVAAGSSGDHLYPVSPPRTRPRIVRSMLEKFGGRERYPLKPTFF